MLSDNVDRPLLPVACPMWTSEATTQAGRRQSREHQLQRKAASYTTFFLWVYEYIDRKEGKNRIQFQLKAKTPLSFSQ